MHLLWDLSGHSGAQINLVLTLRLVNGKRHQASKQSHESHVSPCPRRCPAHCCWDTAPGQQTKPCLTLPPPMPSPLLLWRSIRPANKAMSHLAPADAQPTVVETQHQASKQSHVSPCPRRCPAHCCWDAAPAGCSSWDSWASPPHPRCHADQRHCRWGPVPPAGTQPTWWLPPGVSEQHKRCGSGHAPVKWPSNDQVIPSPIFKTLMSHVAGSVYKCEAMWSLKYTPLSFNLHSTCPTSSSGWAGASAAHTVCTGGNHYLM